MTWTSPATPITLTPITVSFYNVNIRDNLNHLRALMPDPGAANRHYVSSGAASAAWNNSMPVPFYIGNVDRGFDAVGDGLMMKTNFGPSIIAGLDGAYIAYNAIWDGSNWLRMDTALGARIAYVTDKFYLATCAAGANPIIWTISEVATTTGGASNSARLDSGSYSGDSTNNRVITVDFTPKVVIIYGKRDGGGATAVYILVDHSGSVDEALELFDDPSGVASTTGARIQTNAFRVNSGSGNGSDYTYDWVAVG